jgi:uncharacterized protein (TIGR03118 family)
MHKFLRASFFTMLTSGAVVLVGCGGTGNSTGNGTGGNQTAGTFDMVPLIADTAGKAAKTDVNLVDPWGVAYAPGGPFWVANNGSGTATVYSGGGVSQGIVVKIPSFNGGTNGPCTGEVYNGTADFGLGGVAPTFIFVSEDGVISGWTAGANALVAVNNSASGAVYKGIALAQKGAANVLYATNFNSGMVEMYDKNYAHLGNFTDPKIPVGFAPFGIRALNGSIYVTYAMQNGSKHNDVAGPGNGYVDIFTTSGNLEKRLTSNGPLNSPWGMEIAPAGFGNFAGDLLVGNFGDGKINAFKISTGKFDGALLDASNKAVVIPGLWSLLVGNGTGAGSKSDIYFSSGPNKEADGLFGSLNPHV